LWYPNLFNLNDSCHIFSLSIRKSLGELPQNLTKFIVKLHAHFSSSQRKKLLIRIQEQQNGISSPLVLKKYVETRWLSLGQTLERLIKLWEPLKTYMIENLESEKKKANKSKAKSRKSQRKQSKKKEFDHLNFKNILNSFRTTVFWIKLFFWMRLFAELKSISLL